MKTTAVNPRTRPRAELLNAALLLLMLAAAVGCSHSHEATRLKFDRSADELHVKLDSASLTAWSANEDSLVVDCDQCLDGKSHGVIHLGGNEPVLDLSKSHHLKMSLYHNGKVDTVYVLDADDIPDTTTDAGVQEKKSGHRHEGQPKDENRRTHHVTSLRITAPEGVAIYKDKSKREVIKILPKGSVIPFLGREGDMYSVVVDDTEGFVEADAVQVVQ